ncbi:hypothetical protein B0J18DRAFT_69320 [Chaetomium sp. MPI-SDFR-AT-0129]|nr:hypothetical protein B0J18DRAFT_69320 [Chaetomium sp. MPI-SDFR-AT-0129]
MPLYSHFFSHGSTPRAPAHRTNYSRIPAADDCKRTDISSCEQVQGSCIQSTLIPTILVPRSTPETWGQTDPCANQQPSKSNLLPLFLHHGTASRSRARSRKIPVDLDAMRWLLRSDALPSTWDRSLWLFPKLGLTDNYQSRQLPSPIRPTEKTVSNIERQDVTPWPSQACFIFKPSFLHHHYPYNCLIPKLAIVGRVRTTQFHIAETEANTVRFAKGNLTPYSYFTRSVRTPVIGTTK